VIGLQVSDLTIVRGATDGPPAIGPISLSAERGSAIGIVGETGAGKTLTLRALMGLLPAGFYLGGSVELGGDGHIYRTEEELRQQLGRSIGVVLQNPFTAFDPLKSVGAQIVEAVVRRRLADRATARSRSVELLGQMGFDRPTDILKLYPSQLSGGMAQRIAIAMALMPQPTLLLADEPTSALDATLRLGVLELLRRFTATTGAVLVIISHDLRLIARFCDTLIVMYGGRAIETGPAGELLAAPRHPYTNALIACTPTLRAQGKNELASIPGSPPSIFGPERRCRFAPRCKLVEDLCWREEPELVAVSAVRVACSVVTKVPVRE
jgi:oligopeptide/dipeptide ABC transporter ATP-binding protein